MRRNGKLARKGRDEMIGIIDYDAGNIKSVEKALLFLGQEAVVTRDPRILLETR